MSGERWCTRCQAFGAHNPEDHAPLRSADKLHVRKIKGSWYTAHSGYSCKFVNASGTWQGALAMAWEHVPNCYLGHVR